MKHRSTILPAAVVLITVFLIKRMYSHAGAEELRWVLAPSCWLVSVLGGVELEPESGAGFISHAHRMVVGPACAGVNFFVIAILALYFSFQGRFATAPRKLVWLAQCVGIAYVATVLSNGCRILLAAHLYSLDVYGGWLTPGRLHRLGGTVIYCASLFALCAAVARWLEPAVMRGGARPYGATENRRMVERTALFARLVPMGCYLGVAVGVPLVNRAHVRDSRQFFEHVTMVVIVCCVVAGLTALASIARDRLCSRATNG